MKRKRDLSLPANVFQNPRTKLYYGQIYINGRLHTTSGMDTIGEVQAELGRLATQKRSPRYLSISYCAMAEGYIRTHCWRVRVGKERRGIGRGFATWDDAWAAVRALKLR